MILAKKYKSHFQDIQKFWNQTNNRNFFGKCIIKMIIKMEKVKKRKKI